jgi:hypothetical protein
VIDTSLNDHKEFLASETTEKVSMLSPLATIALDASPALIEQGFLFS